VNGARSEDVDEHLDPDHAKHCAEWVEGMVGEPPLTRCDACGGVIDDHHHEWTCLRRKNRRRRSELFKQGLNPAFYVVVSMTTRHYGGPEEGGWWYNRQTNEEVLRFYTFKAAREFLRAFKGNYPDPRYPITSAANRGEGQYHPYLCADESEFPGETPPGRPHYE
jgi:hypothetical protein